MTNSAHGLAHETYNIKYWSDGFFDIDSDGYVVLGSRISDKPIKLQHIVDQCIQKHSNLSLPLLIRFPDIIKSRVTEMVTAFDKAFKNNSFAASYTPAYPIKVNQQQSVVNSFLECGQKVALEAGSKPELFTIIALGVQHGTEIICNGYKDKDYIKLALLGQRLGLNVNIIVEKLSELELVLKEAAHYNIKPILGVRVRLSSLGKGNWQNSGGVKSKFGLNSLQLLSFLDQLKTENKLDCLKLLHFHMGSQISDLEDIQNGLTEAARLYAEINRSGAKLESIDIGGGLGVDYEGTSSRSYYSINYNIDNYADIVVKTIKNICVEENLPPPRIITESGRAMVAHHALLVTDIIDVEPIMPKDYEEDLTLENAGNHEFVRELKHCLAELDKNNRGAMEIYHQARRVHDLAQDFYVKGQIHLPLRAVVEQLYYKICLKLLTVLDPRVRTHVQLLDSLNEDMADKVFCNFSLFQSMPDIWGLDQIFPIIPLSQLNSVDDPSKTIRGILQDMTCDSDGRIDKYIDGKGVENSLPLPAYDPNNPYYMGFFMIGAYQEILGDLHNLFGDTATVDVNLNKDNFTIDSIKSGDLISDVMRFVDFDAQKLLDNLINKFKSIESDPAKQKNLLSFLSQYINNSPYYS